MGKATEKPCARYDGALQPLAYSAKDLGVLLRCSARQIWSMHSAGTLGPALIKLSTRITRWDRREVETWYAACRDAGRIVTRGEWLRRVNEDGGER